MNGDANSMAALAKAIEGAVAALSGIQSILYILHDVVQEQPKLCDALVTLESLAGDHAERLSTAGHAAGLTN